MVRMLTMSSEAAYTMMRSGRLALTQTKSDETCTHNRSADPVCCSLCWYSICSQCRGIRLLFVCVIFVSGAFLAWFLLWLQARGSLSFSHIIVAWLVVNGTCLLWGVMYLAATGADNIAETRAYVVTELLGTVGGSLVKSMVKTYPKTTIGQTKGYRSSRFVRQSL